MSGDTSSRGSSATIDSSVDGGDTETRKPKRPEAGQSSFQVAARQARNTEDVDAGTSMQNLSIADDSRADRIAAMEQRAKDLKANEDVHAQKRARLQKHKEKALAKQIANPPSSPGLDIDPPLVGPKDMDVDQGELNETSESSDLTSMDELDARALADRRKGKSRAKGKGKAQEQPAPQPPVQPEDVVPMDLDTNDFPPLPPSGDSEAGPSSTRPLSSPDPNEGTRKRQKMDGSTNPAFGAVVSSRRQAAEKAEARFKGMR